MLKSNYKAINLEDVLSIVEKYREKENTKFVVNIMDNLVQYTSESLTLWEILLIHQELSVELYDNRFIPFTIRGYSEDYLPNQVVRFSSERELEIGFNIVTQEIIDLFNPQLLFMLANIKMLSLNYEAVAEDIMGGVDMSSLISFYNGLVLSKSLSLNYSKEILHQGIIQYNEILDKFKILAIQGNNVDRKDSSTLVINYLVKAMKDTKMSINGYLSVYGDSDYTLAFPPLGNLKKDILYPRPTNINLGTYLDVDSQNIQDLIIKYGVDSIELYESTIIIGVKEFNFYKIAELFEVLSGDLGLSSGYLGLLIKKNGIDSNKDSTLRSRTEYVAEKNKLLASALNLVNESCRITSVLKPTECITTLYTFSKLQELGLPITKNASLYNSLLTGLMYCDLLHSTSTLYDYYTLDWFYELMKLNKGLGNLISG